MPRDVGLFLAWVTGCFIGQVILLPLGAANPSLGFGTIIGGMAMLVFIRTFGSKGGAKC